LNRISTNEFPEVPSSQKRIVWIDVAKTLAVILVFYGHFVGNFISSDSRPALLQMKFIYSFHVPLFFILSGLIYREKNYSWTDFLKSRFSRRFVPYLFFNLLFMTLWIGKSIVIVKRSWSVINTECLLRTSRLFFLGIPTWNVVTWFLICLMMVEIIQFALRNYIRSTGRLILSLIFFASMTVVISYFNDAVNSIKLFEYNYWSVKSALTALFFYQFGILLQKTNFLNLKLSPALSVLPATLFLIITLLTFNQNQGPFPVEYHWIAIGGTSYGNPFLFLLTALTGSFFIIFTGQALSSFKILSWMGLFTLPLFCLNGIMLNNFNGIFVKLFHILRLNPESPILSLYCSIQTLICLATCIPVLLLLRKYIPWTQGRGFGSTHST